MSPEARRCNIDVEGGAATLDVGRIHRGWWIGFKTLVGRECAVIVRFWGYTLAPPIVTTVLYFAIFGEVLGRRIGPTGGIPYIQFIAPGLTMLWVVVQAYGHTAGALVGARFFRFIEELLVSPLPDWIVVLGYVVSGTIRGVGVGVAVLATTLLFTRIPVDSFVASFAVLMLAALISSLGGFVAALFAKSFDQAYGIQNFVLTPLLYVGGVFNSVSALPDWAQTLSRANPMFYMVNTFRYAVLGVSDVPFEIGVSITAIAGLILFIAAVALMHSGTGIRE